MARKTLTAKNIRTLPAPARGQVEYFDTVLGHGFGLRVTSQGHRAFVLFYRPRGGPRRGKLVRWTLGELSQAFDLGAARQKARDALQRIVHEHADPAAEDAAAKDSDVATDPETYQQAVEDYVARYQVGERGNATAGEVRRVLLKEGAAWLHRPLAEIAARDIRRRLEELRDGTADGRPRPYLANRTYAHLRTFFRWCAEPGIDKVERSPMEGLRKPWAQEAARDRVFTDAELAALWKAADGFEPYRGAFVKLALLTGKRKGALAAMRWQDIDDDGLWTPPNDPRRRRQTKRTHGIPLPGLALRILRSLPRVEDNPYVFVGRRTGQPLDPGTPLQRAVQEGSGVADFYFHAARHTVETRLADLQVPPHVRDMLLDHAPARGAGAGYDHYTYAREMREALERWNQHLVGILRAHDVWQGSVEPLHG